jgi:hypothetical protein
LVEILTLIAHAIEIKRKKIKAENNDIRHEQRGMTDK